MRKTVAIVSLRFNPAFLQHLIAFAKAVRELGLEPQFLLDREYERFSELTQVAPMCHSYERSSATAWSHAIFLNASTGNPELAMALHRDNVKIVYVYHEPWHMSGQYFWSEGIIGTAKAIAAHRLTVPVLKLSATVILESRFGMRMYEQADARYNSNYVYFPQIYDDDVQVELSDLVHGKRYFSFLGTLCRSHGFDQYLGFMLGALERGADLRFLIASRNALPPSLEKDARFQQSRDRIEIRCGRPLTNDEMNRCYAESFCVWNVYRRSTQSGVLPKAMMFGTPVLASAAGSFPEYVRDGENGRFVDAEQTDAILSALEDIQRNIPSYAANCRKSFRDNFFYQSQVPELRLILR
ncbi:MAG TPA: glycosyltransferase [Terracidiphilus sp.]